MNQESQNTSSSLELPQPDTDASSVNNTGVEQSDSNSSTEAAMAAALEHGASGGTTPTDPAAMLPPASVTSQIDDNSASNTALYPLPTPSIADDGDLIEKEWVEKAKDIVNRTKHDPYNQNKEINHIKADYMRKRYNKEIKLDEDI